MVADIERQSVVVGRSANRANSDQYYLMRCTWGVIQNNKKMLPAQVV